MRWYSTVQSADNFEFTVLSVIESIAAISVSLWIAWEYHTVMHIVIASLIAPLLLLRTEESTKRGLKYFSKLKIIDIDNLLKDTSMSIMGIGVISVSVYYYFGTNSTVWTTFILSASFFLYFLDDKYSFTKKLSGWLVLLLVTVPVMMTVIAIAGASGTIGAAGVGMGVGSLIAKFIATLQTLFLSPIKTLEKIPRNWQRIVFCMDSAHPPEILPGIESKKYIKISESFDNFKFGKWVDSITDNIREGDILDRLLGLVFLSITPLLFLPALAYRWSLKSSSIIWLPLIWIINPKPLKEPSEADTNKKLSIQLDSLRNTVLAKITAIYAFLIIIPMSILPLILKGKASELSDKLVSDAGGVILDKIINFFLAFQIQAWHVSRFLVALLTLFTFFYADKLIRKRAFEKEAGLHSAPYLLRTLTLLRTPLSLFTIACGLYLLLSPISWHEMFQNMQWLPF